MPLPLCRVVVSRLCLLPWVSLSLVDFRAAPARRRWSIQVKSFLQLNGQPLSILELVTREDIGGETFLDLQEEHLKSKDVTVCIRFDCAFV